MRHEPVNMTAGHNKSLNVEQHQKWRYNEDYTSDTNVLTKMTYKSHHRNSDTSTREQNCSTQLCLDADYESIYFSWRMKMFFICASEVNLWKSKKNFLYPDDKSCVQYYSFFRLNFEKISFSNWMTHYTFHQHVFKYSYDCQFPYIALL